MADTQTGPPAGEKDSGLSMTSNILGIFTFAFAVLLGAWLRYHQWHSAQKELTEFEEYLEVHTVELDWMRLLLHVQGKNTIAQTLLTTRVDPYSAQFATVQRPIGTISSRMSLEVPPPGTSMPTTARQIGAESARQRIRKAGKSVVYQKREEKAKEQKLSDLKYNLRARKKAESKEFREAEDRMIDKILHDLSDLDKELQEIISRVREIDHHHPSLTTEEGMSQPLKPGSIHAEHARPSQAANGSTAHNTLKAQQSTPDPSRPHNIFDRIAAYFITKYPKSWMATRIISLNWLRVRDRAFELRRKREILWNRMHASQLVLLSRRIEDQDEQIDMVDEHMTRQFRFVLSAVMEKQEG